MKKLAQYLSSIGLNIICTITVTILISFLSTVPVTAQSNLQHIGHWQLQKVSFKNMVADPAEKDNDLFLGLFKAALYEKLTEEQRLTLEDLELVNTEAEILRDTYYQSTIEFKANGAFYNTSLNKDKSLSGEYLLDKKKLMLEWETADKTKFKIIKNTSNDLVFKDIDFNIIYHYLKAKIY